MDSKYGFTLIELLVVISIISLLSSFVLVGLQKARNNAKATRARQDIDLLVNAIQLASQNEGGVTLKQITGSGCSECPCRGQQLKNISKSSTCFQGMQSAIEKISKAAGPAYTDLEEKLARDPWGAPYLIDENESTSGSGLGTIKSAGPDGIAPGHSTGEIGRRIPES
ncbi:MAG: hypothetical protein BRC25_03195 [Parcubacteria group bacterium SW_6_46_9]|nr:MAG: hypothetical protein BRC25_03195 [Parcubacteria group bacterium SW_6_46_9]